MNKQEVMALLGANIAKDIEAIGATHANNLQAIDDLYEYAIANDNADGTSGDQRLLMFEWYRLMRKICIAFESDKEIKVLSPAEANK